MAGALGALAIWPWFVQLRAAPAPFSPAPVIADYLSRDRLVAFEEREVRASPTDQILARMLAGQYMQRFRERYDLGDILRARRFALRSLQLQPQGNTAAQMTLASTYLAFHRFREALQHERAAVAGEPFDANARAQIASLQMELGEYAEARTTLAAIPATGPEDPTVDSIWARFYELTGHIDRARVLMQRATLTIDSNVSNPAYDRSWFHMRNGQLAFESGDFETSQEELTISLTDFPGNAGALLWEARMYRAQKRWPQALAAASRSAGIYPLPQALGYQADAQRALGQAVAARATEALVGAEERLFNAQGINDRLLANYYAQRRIHLNEALQAAKDDYRRRGDEIYSCDTMAWVLAAMGRWHQALPFARLALRTGTQDSEVRYHAAMVELHNGRPERARELLQSALSNSSNFDAFEAADARDQLAKL
jgi:tetratricopeptide (TPR) repeat protein